MSGLLINHNFAKSSLASGITDADLTLDLAAGDGAKFPATGDFVCVLWDSAYASPVSDLTREIIKVTSRSTDELTFVRAQESTSAKAWNADDHCALVITAGKLNEIEDEVSHAFTTGNLLQNSSWAIHDNVAANAPAGWTISGAGATVTIAAGTYGWRKLTLTAGAGASATLSQTLPADVPKVSGANYGLAAFALVDSGGTGSLAFDAISAAVTNTSYELKQATGTVTGYAFSMTIDATHAITVELPTVVFGKSLPYPMYGQKDLIGLEALGPAGRGTFCGSLAAAASKVIDITGLAKASTATVLSLTVYWQAEEAITAVEYGGVLKGVQFKASGGTFVGPSLFAEGFPSGSSKSSITEQAGYVCLYDNSDKITLKNNLAVAIRVTIDYIWG